MMKQTVLALLGTLVAVCFFIQADYASSPGVKGDVPEFLSKFHIDTSLMPSAQTKDMRETACVILFYHPHCPCTRATVNNLDLIQQTIKRSVRLFAFAYHPKSKDSSWINTPVTRQLAKIGFETTPDPGATVCQRFGVFTSGHVLAYNKSGKLVFNGGVTTSRGHEGTGVPMSELISSINQPTKQTAVWPVFGCPIVKSEALNK